MDIAKHTITAAAGAAAEVQPGRQLLRLTVGASMFAIDIDAVREILKAVQLTEVPLMPSFVRGVMNLRGAVVPVIDLGARLGGQPSAVTRRTCIVVVDVGGSEQGQTLGVFVDAVHEVFGADGLEPVPSLGMQVPSDFLAGIARAGEQTVPVLSTERVLDLEELAHLIAHDGGSNARH